MRHAAQTLAKVLPNAQLLSKKGLGHTKKLNTKMIAEELALFYKGNHSTDLRKEEAFHAKR
ncbi:hypothetical protein D3C71_1942960 [compost metagenome]